MSPPLLAAGQNLDRLVTTYRAARRAERTLVVDLYSATLARATGRPTMPQPGTHDVRVYIPSRQRVLVKGSGEFERTRAVATHRVYLEELRASAGGFALLAQTSTLAELGRAGCLDRARAAWSMWAGYLDTGSGRRAGELLARFEVPLEVMHASGHAAVADLRRLVDAYTPKCRRASSHGSTPPAVELTAALLISSFGQLQFEIEGYNREGVISLEKDQMERLRVIDPRSVEAGTRDTILAEFRALSYPVDNSVAPREQPRRQLTCFPRRASSNCR